MKAYEYTHLHVHSDASLKDGLGTVERLIGRAADLKYDALALTDHGSLANTVSFVVHCQRAGIKPIIGLEGYVAVDGEVGHITLLAHGDNGWRNLVLLNNLGHAGTHKSPAFSLENLIHFSEDIVCLTGCVSSPLHKMGYEDAKRLGARLKTAFGPRLFAEVMFVSDTDTWTRPIRLAKDLGLKLVLTNDSHFPFKADAQIHPLLTKMKAGFEYNSRELWLKSPEEMLARAVRQIGDRDLVFDMMGRAYNLSQRIITPNLRGELALPDTEFDAGLVDIAHHSLADYLEDEDDPEVLMAYNKRLHYEAKVITEAGYLPYFSILWDIVSQAKVRGVKVGPGRGSGAGSLFLFLLGITEIDPIKYDLSFERFLNPERKGMPDVDIDFDSESRDIVINYARARWSAIPIATYARYSHKTLVHDLSKLLRVPRPLEKEAAEGDAPAFEELCKNFPSFYPCYEAFAGQIRHKGRHAGGVVITKSYVPIERAGDNKVVAWTEGKVNELSYAGVVKFDLLGLSALHALDLLEKQYGRKADEPTEGHPAFEIFKSGDLSGIFQFSGSKGIHDLTVRLIPNSFDDLIAINALYRPGALDVGATDKYPEWKKKPRKVLPLIRDILAPTYGAIVFQEQVMTIYSRITGGTLGEADLARRVIVKSKVDDPEWLEEFSALQEAFVSAAVSKGVSIAGAEKLWHEMAAHARYSFNKAHATAYAKIAWDLAWWKWNNPTAFYAAMMNIDKENIQKFIVEAIKKGIEVVPPNVNISENTFVAYDEKIYIPLSAVKFVGRGAEAIIRARGTIKGGHFSTFSEFMSLVPKKELRANGRAGLYQLGAFADLTGKTEELLLGKKPLSSNPRDYLGFVIPTKEQLDRLSRGSTKDWTAGIITEVRKKESKWGLYNVYYLAPEGIFWSRTYHGAVGDAVKVKVNSKSGRATTVQPI